MPSGFIPFVPASLKDERAKDNFANAARLICIGYEVTAAALVLEAWIKVARPGERLDMTEPAPEAFDRREVVVLTGETVEHSVQRLLSIIRADAGGFFGLGEHEGPKFDNFTGGFAQSLPPNRPPAKDRELARAMPAAMRITENQCAVMPGRIDLLGAPIDHARPSQDQSRACAQSGILRHRHEG